MRIREFFLPLFLGVGLGASVVLFQDVGRKGKKISPISVSSRAGEVPRIKKQLRPVLGDLLVPDLEDIVAQHTKNFGSYETWPPSAVIGVNEILKRWDANGVGLDAVSNLLEGCVSSGVDPRNLSYALVTMATDKYGIRSIGLLTHVKADPRLFSFFSKKLIAKVGSSVVPDLIQSIREFSSEDDQRGILYAMLQSLATCLDFDRQDIKGFETLWKNIVGQDLWPNLRAQRAASGPNNESRFLVGEYLAGRTSDLSSEQLEIMAEILWRNPFLLDKKPKNFPEAIFKADHWAIADAFMLLSESAPEKALDWLGQRTPGWRVLFIENNYQRLSSSLVAKIFQEIADHNKNLLSPGLVASLAIRGLAGDAVATVAGLSRLSEKGAFSDWSTILDELPGGLPIESRIELSTELPESILTNAENLEKIGRWLARESPERAFEWVSKSVQDESLKSKMAEAIISEWSRNDPVSAGNWLKSSEVPLTETTSGEISIGLASWNLELAKSWIQSLPEEFRASNTLAMIESGVVPLAMAKEQVENLLSEGHPASPKFSAAVGLIAGRFATEDPVNGIEWVQSLPSEPLRKVATLNLVREWSKWNPYEVGSLLNRIPANTISDDTIASFIGEIPGQADTALAWAAEIKDQTRRLKTAAQVLGNAAQNDPSQVSAILDEAGFSENEKAKILSNVPPN